MGKQEPYKIQQGQMQSLAPGKAEPLQWYRLETDWLGSRSVEKAMEASQTVNWAWANSAMVANRVNTLLGCINRSRQI